MFLFPYAMKYSFTLNEAIITQIRETFIGNNNYDEIVGSYIGAISELQYDNALEERSPEYIGRGDHVYSVGSVEATFKYYESLATYQKRGDLMRIMRAMAGITGRLIYVILWFIMLWQMLVLLFLYIKRYLMIAFLIIIFPITIIEYIIGATVTGKSSSFSAWCMEFFLNVFIQTIHAISYGIIGGVVIAHIQNGIVNGNLSQMNWVLLIIAVNFLFEAEKIIKKIIKASGNSVGDATGISSGLKGAAKKIKNAFVFDD